MEVEYLSDGKIVKFYLIILGYNDYKSPNNKSPNPEPVPPQIE